MKQRKSDYILLTRDKTESASITEANIDRVKNNPNLSSYAKWRIAKVMKRLMKNRKKGRLKYD